MQGKGITLAQFTSVTMRVSAEHYAGNVIVNSQSRDAAGGNSVVRLTVTDSHGPGSRTSARGRHGPFACWHAHRDVYRAALAEFPTAKFIGGRYWVVTYEAATFESVYRKTAHVNVGSMFSPCTMPELCGCYTEMDEVAE
jgi:hypothetical protein